MRAALLLSLFTFGACTSHNASQATDALTCAANQTAVYTNRFASLGGSSGVATPTDAIAGVTNSAPTAQPETNDDSVTAMTASCGPSICDPGQVAVEIDAVPESEGSGAEGAPVSSGASTSGVASASPSSSPSSSSSSSSSSTPAQTTSPTMVCVPPPPACPPGQSPQYTDSGNWDCTDCALVVTYGSEFGNSRRCVGAPTVKCHGSDVPTWSYDDNKWECQPECDNGEYDQHVIAGQTVCVPC